MRDSVIDNGTARPKILVLGATGGTGRLIVSQAVTRGYDVTALVRSAQKATGLEGSTETRHARQDPGLLFGFIL
jgi:uncharacterized protein YbjT (DUF2867 family)